MSWVYNAVGDPPTNGPALFAGALSVTTLALVTVILRLYVRLVMIKAPGWDDLIIVIAWIGACGYTTATCIQTKWGLGLTNINDMPLENNYNFGLIQYIGAPFYVIGIWGFKMSLLFSYLRFMPKGFYRNLTIGVAVAVTAGHIAFFCVFLFLCTPIAKQWDPALATVGHCADAVPFYLTFSSLTIVFDVVVLVLPFPVLVRSQIQRRKKVVLLGLFALGLFVTIIQAIRIQTIKNLVNYLDSARSIIWSIVENDIGIIIANIPTLAPLVKYYAEKTRSGTASNSRKPDSRYALQTWRSGKSGMKPLGSGVDFESKEGSSVGVGTSKDNESTDNILNTTGIVKTMDVSVTRQQARANGDVESLPESNNFDVERLPHAH